MKPHYKAVCPVFAETGGKCCFHGEDPCFYDALEFQTDYPDAAVKAELAAEPLIEPKRTPALTKNLATIACVASFSTVILIMML
jgi:hypothetical protein